MHSKWKKSITLGILLFVFMIPVNLGIIETANAADLNKNTDIPGQIDIQIIAHDAENDRSLALVRQNPNGQVTGDGVRLRSTPSTSGTILEKMYYGEYVWIDWNMTGTSHPGWYFLKRLKTGTNGWASSSYIYTF